MSGILKLAIASAVLAATLVTLLEGQASGPAKADRAVTQSAPLRTGEADRFDPRPVRIIPLARKEARAMQTGAVSV